MFEQTIRGIGGLRRSTKRLCPDMLLCGAPGFTYPKAHRTRDSPGLWSKGDLPESKRELGTQARVPRYRHWGFPDCTRDLGSDAEIARIQSYAIFFKAKPNIQTSCGFNTISADAFCSIRPRNPSLQALPPGDYGS